MTTSTQDAGESIMIEPILPTKILELRKSVNDRFIFLDLPSRFAGDLPETLSISEKLNSSALRSNLANHDFQFIPGDTPDMFRVNIGAKQPIPPNSVENLDKEPEVELTNNHPIKRVIRRQPLVEPIYIPPVVSNEVNSCSRANPLIPFAYCWQNCTPPPDFNIFLIQSCLHLTPSLPESVKHDVISQSIERYKSAFFLHKFRHFCKLFLNENESSQRVFDLTYNWYTIVKELFDDEGNLEVDVLFVLDKVADVSRIDKSDKKRNRRGPVRFEHWEQVGQRYILENRNDENENISIYDYDSAFSIICSSFNNSTNDNVIHWSALTSDFAFLPSLSFPFAMSNENLEFSGWVNVSQYNPVPPQKWELDDVDDENDGDFMHKTRAIFNDYLRAKLKQLYCTTDIPQDDEEIDNDEPIELLFYHSLSSGSLNGSPNKIIDRTPEMANWKQYINDLVVSDSSDVKKRKRSRKI